MSTTIIDVPDFFDERFINDILETERFEQNELHPHELADLWGFVKYFHRDGVLKRSKFPMTEFKELCNVVEKEELRYEIGGIGPKSPHQLAVEVSRKKSYDYDERVSKSYDINLERMRKQESVVEPVYDVFKLEEGSVRVVFDDEVYLSDSDEFVGEDYLGNEYRINVRDVHEELGTTVENERYFDGGITTFEFNV